jgi:hypothetical protein
VPDGKVDVMALPAAREQSAAHLGETGLSGDRDPAV